MRPVLLFAVFALAATAPAQIPLRIEITVPSTAPLNGHLVLVIAKPGDRGVDGPEPRFQMEETYQSAQAFGVDAVDLAPGQAIVVDDATVGYPLPNLRALPAGDYVVQAVFNRYEPFHMASGKTLMLPPDKGEGQHWERKPGNAYNAPVMLHLDPASHQPLKLTLDRTIPAIEGTDLDPAVIATKDPGAAKYLKWIRFRSEQLSRFWGRDMFLGAWVLLPAGFEEHPAARYPLVVYQDHYRATIGPDDFRSTAPAPGLEGRELARAKRAHQFFEDWTGGRLPRVILLYVQNANPFYDDSYVVDSANVGPYGAAINEELIPEIERRFRGIGQGWARATFGGSTGGWEALATQVLYPDQYNGTWAACPDPVDFHAYQNINLYNDTNAFVRRGDFGEVPIAADRRPDGSVIANTGPEYRYEYVLGTHGRSTEQWNIWQAVFSPVGPDGYPAEVIDPLTGAIHKDVVGYWRDHWDLTAVLERDWATLGPKLEGKIHVQVGDGDTYFLNNAVHLLQQSLEKTRSPHSDAQFQYGPGEPHCYTGGPPEYTMQQNNAQWIERVLPQMTRHMIDTAPPAADTRSWVY